MWQVATILALCLALATHAVELDPQYVDKAKAFNAGLNIARKALRTSRCEQAFRDEFPELASVSEIDLLLGFKIVKIVPTTFANPTVSGAVNCDINPLAILVSEQWSLWREPDRYASTLVHEFAHILQCKEVLQKWGSYGNLQKVKNDRSNAVLAGVAVNYEQELEKAAYRIGGTCTETEIPEFAKRQPEVKTKEKK